MNAFNPKSMFIGKQWYAARPNYKLPDQIFVVNQTHTHTYKFSHKCESTKQTPTVVFAHIWYVGEKDWSLDKEKWGLILVNCGSWSTLNDWQGVFQWEIRGESVWREVLAELER